MDIKKNWQAWFKSFFDKKTGSGTKSNVNEVLAEELHKSMIKNSKEGTSPLGLKTIFGQQI